VIDRDSGMLLGPAAGTYSWNATGVGFAQGLDWIASVKASH